VPETWSWSALSPVVLASSLIGPVGVVEPATIVGTSLVPVAVTVTNWLTLVPLLLVTITL
jgi:hypothetical protein